MLQGELKFLSIWNTDIWNVEFQITCAPQFGMCILIMVQGGLSFSGLLMRKRGTAIQNPPVIGKNLEK